MYGQLEDRRIDDVFNIFVPVCLYIINIKQIDSMLQCICSVKDHSKRQNVELTTNSPSKP